MRKANRIAPSKTTLWYLMRSHVITCDRMRSQAIACDLEKKLFFPTVQVLENASGTRSGAESLPKVFLRDNCEHISFIIFFAFLKKEEMRSGTRFTLQKVFLLFTVVVTKHVWPYFQSRFPKTSSERVSSCRRWLDAAGNGGRRLKQCLQRLDGQRHYWQ